MDYNYFKTLPKDVLIKILTEINETHLKERDEWFAQKFANIIKDSDMTCCGSVGCYRIANTSIDHDFSFCEECEDWFCPPCQQKIGIIKCRSCELELCFDHNNTYYHISYDKDRDDILCNKCLSGW